MIPIVQEKAYFPTQAEIEAACAEIQATWTDQEKAARRMKTSRPAIKCNFENVKRDAGSALVGKLARIRQAVA